MEFGLSDDEEDTYQQAEIVLSARLSIDRFKSFEQSQATWKAIAADGWFNFGENPKSTIDNAPSLLLKCGIGQIFGRYLAGDIFINNGIILNSADPPLTEGYLVSDGRTQSLLSDDWGNIPWYYGIEPGLTPYRVDSTGSVWSMIEMSTATNSGDYVGIQSPTLVQGSKVGQLDITESLWLSTQIVYASSLVGLADEALKLSRDYAENRVQFGKPIGSNQAIKHPLADIAVQVEIAANAVLIAAKFPSQWTAIISLLEAKKAANYATSFATQCFGGIGITWEHPNHLYLKTARNSLVRFGSINSHCKNLVNLYQKQIESSHHELI